MAFNHYAKMKRILLDYPGWLIVRIDKQTSSKGFNGETRVFDHYYRACDKNGEFIKFCKFQQIDLFSKSIGIAVESLPIITESDMAELFHPQG